MSELQVNKVSFKTGQSSVVKEVSFSLVPGELIALLGANGAGKTTLLRCCIGLQKATTGTALINAHPAHRLAADTRAKAIAYLPQVRTLAWPGLVRDVVALGRFSYGAIPGKLGDTHAAAVERAIEACDLNHLAHRRADTLSGGELARVHCARAFAAEAPLLIADEPTAALDPRQQFRVMDLIERYVAEGGGALVVLHDLQMAVNKATRLLWMHDGRIVADGTPIDTLTSERLAQVYGVNARVDGLTVTLDGAIDK